MEHSGWTLTPLCLLWCLPLRLRPLRSKTALQRLCLTPANCLTLSDERLTFHTVHQRSGPLVGPEVGAESKEVHHSLRLCSAHNFFIYLFYFFKKNLLQLFTTEESCWSWPSVCENLDTFPVCRPQAVYQPVVRRWGPDWCWWDRLSQVTTFNLWELISTQSPAQRPRLQINLSQKTGGF